MYIVQYVQCAAAYIALRSIVIVELLGIQKLTNAFGLCALFQGVACVLGSPMSGKNHPSVTIITLSSPVCSTSSAVKHRCNKGNMKYGIGRLPEYRQ